jgi:hypothetical protein
VATSSQVYLEIGRKRTFAAAVEWPGWCRPGRDESEALEALVEFAPKYSAVLAHTALGFEAPKSAGELAVVERLEGNATTDFGAPGVVPRLDLDRNCSPAEVQRLATILRAGWTAFDSATKAARGKTLATGPRGGGRALAAIIEHVVAADASYLGGVGWKAPKGVGPAVQLAATREAILAALEASATGQIPAKGPRGGTRWPARYFVRRVAWHVIAHAWEIERRTAKPITS